MAVVQADIATYKTARADLATRKVALVTEEQTQHAQGLSLAAELRAALVAAESDAESLEATIAADAKSAESWVESVVKRVGSAL